MGRAFGYCRSARFLLLLAVGLLVRGQTAFAANDFACFGNIVGGRRIDPAWLKTSDQDEAWPTLTFGEHAGPRFRIAVMPVLNKPLETPNPDQTLTARIEIPYGAPAQSNMKVPVDGVEQLMTASLLTSNRLQVERANLEALGECLDPTNWESEQAGRTAKPSVMQIGRALGVQFIVQASVNKWRPGTSKLFPGIQKGNASCEVQMTVNLFDATTGEVVVSTVISGTAKSRGMGLTGQGFLGDSIVDGITGLDSRQSITQALVCAISKATYIVVDKLNDRPWEGTIAEVNGQELIINCGASMGMKPGMDVVVLSRGSVLPDPETVEEGGHQTDEIGSATISRTSQRFSIAKISTGCLGVKKGDVVHFKRGD